MRARAQCSATSSGACPSTLNQTVGAWRVGDPIRRTCGRPASPSSSRRSRDGLVSLDGAMARAAADGAGGTVRRGPERREVVDGGGDPACWAKGDVPRSNRSGTSSTTESSLSARSPSSRSGAATSAARCGPDHL
jgi:hypothetical protein